MLTTLLLTVFRVKELTLVFNPPLRSCPPPFPSLSMEVKNVTAVHLPLSNLIPGVGGLGGAFTSSFLPPTNTDLRVTLLRFKFVRHEHSLNVPYAQSPYVICSICTIQIIISNYNKEDKSTPRLPLPDPWVCRGFLKVQSP